jgi:DNA (cytosine-5)-methyltransferase 1
MIKTESLPSASSTFRFIDLFAGIGGFHHAMTPLGGECVLACELDPEARSVYQAAFPDLPPERFIANIRTITRTDVEDEASGRTTEEIARLVPDHDLLCAGFPCQPFSKSGRQLGVRDTTRGTLFFDILEILRAKRPRWCLLENVRNLAGPRHTDTWNTIVHALREVGYEVSETPLVLSPHVLRPELGGAPQVRERVFIAGTYVGDKAERLHPPPIIRREELPAWNTHSWSIADYLDEDRNISDVEAHRLGTAALTWLDAWDYFVRECPAEQLPGFPLWAFAMTESPALRAEPPDWELDFTRKNTAFYRTHKSFIDSWLQMRWGPDQKRVIDFPHSRQKFEWQARVRHPGRTNRTIQDLVIQLRPSGIRVKPASYLPALVAITQTSIVGPRVRAGIEHYRELTPREAARLQGIPSEPFDIADVPARAAYKQLGNAVNSGTVRYVAEVLMGRRLMDAATTSRQTPLF